MLLTQIILLQFVSPIPPDTSTHNQLEQTIELMNLYTKRYGCAP